MTPNWFSNLFKTQRLSPKEEYILKLAKYIKTYGQAPTGTRTGQWLEPVAQQILGSRWELYKLFKSKNEAIEAAKTLINQKRV